MIKSTFSDSLNKAVLWKKTFLRYLLCLRLEMGFDCMIMKEREDVTEKKDFMIISNYLSTVLINLLFTHTLSHTCTQIHILSMMAILFQRRDKFGQKCAWLLHEDYDFHFQQLTLPQIFFFKYILTFPYLKQNNQAQGRINKNSWFSAVFWTFQKEKNCSSKSRSQ